MEAKIIAEDGDDIGIEVTDTDGVEHRIVMGFEGEINGYKNDGYPSKPDDRTTTEQEKVFHARRYAKYHVAQETEYDTLPWDLNPERFEQARAALLALSDEAVEEWFGRLHAQSLSHYTDHPEVDTGDVERPYALPAEKIGPEGALTYEQELYLDDAGALEAVSGVHIAYYVAKGERTRVRHGDAPEREPDARIELSPAPLVAPGPFRDYLAYNLRCQIRDCYIGMGLEPPEAYRVLGPGQYRFTGKYQHFELYPEYYDKDADIPGYSHAFAPELPIDDAELAGLIDADSDRSIYDQIKSALFSV